MKKVMHAVSVDDEKINLSLIEQMSRDLDLDIRSFTNPLEALEYTNPARENPVDIVFVDYLMPEMDGIDFIHRMRLHYNDIPVVMITAVTSDVNLKLRALKAGATDFLHKPLDIAEFSAKVKNLSELRRSQLFYQDWAAMLDVRVKEAIAEIKSRENETLSVLARAAEYKDPETGNHIQRVAEIAKVIGENLQLSEKDLALLYHAAPLHDIGKMGIPDDVLLKPGKLSADEWKIMQTHTSIGEAIMRNADSPFLQSGAVVAQNHHEKYNGKGYPNGLSGEKIPLFGRIIAVADVFDALVSKRPYKEPWPMEKALDLIHEERGHHFDPRIADIFLQHSAEARRIEEQFAD